MHDFNEIEKVREFTNGSQQAFTEIFLKYNRWVYNEAYRRCGKERQEAEDIVQEVFIKLWEKRAEVDPERRLGTFLYTITKNACINRMEQKNIRRQNLLAHLKGQEQHIDPTTIMDKAELAAQLHQAIEKITAPNQRTVMKMYIRGKSHKEISKETGLKIRTVYNYIVRGLESLKKNF